MCGFCSFMSTIVVCSSEVSRDVVASQAGAVNAARQAAYAWMAGLALLPHGCSRTGCSRQRYIAGACRPHIRARPQRAGLGGGERGRTAMQRQCAAWASFCRGERAGRWFMAGAVETLRSKSDHESDREASPPVLHAPALTFSLAGGQGALQAGRRAWVILGQTPANRLCPAFRSSSGPRVDHGTSPRRVKLCVPCCRL